MKMYRQTEKKRGRNAISINKEVILKALKNREGHFISGAVLAKELKISRTAVWKQINNLEKEGYQIESLPRLGYRLRFIPDLLLPAEVREGLTAKTFGQHIHFYSETPSTQEIAKKLASQGAPHGTAVITEHQTAGRGRRGRSWFCPPHGGIMFSLILYPPLPPQAASVITLMAGVGVARGLQKAYPIPCRLKWPNDIMAEGKKLGGILTEMASEVDKIHYLVLGIGINANVKKESFPPELSDQATSLSLIQGKKVDRVFILQHLLEELEEAYELLLHKGPPAVIAEWRSLSATLGQEVEVHIDQQTLCGRARDIDEDGALILEQAENKLLRITTGDVVHLR